MTLGQVLGVVCIVIGFITGAIGDGREELLFDSLTWFVAGIAIVMTLGGVGPTFGNRKPA